MSSRVGRAGVSTHRAGRPVLPRCTKYHTWHVGGGVGGRRTIDAEVGERRLVGDAVLGKPVVSLVAAQARWRNAYRRWRREWRPGSQVGRDAARRTGPVGPWTPCGRSTMSSTWALGRRPRPSSAAVGSGADDVVEIAVFGGVVLVVADAGITVVVDSATVVVGASEVDVVDDEVDVDVVVVVVVADVVVVVLSAGEVVEVVGVVVGGSGSVPASVGSAGIRLTNPASTTASVSRRRGRGRGVSSPNMSTAEATTRPCHGLLVPCLLVEGADAHLVESGVPRPGSSTTHDVPVERIDPPSAGAGVVHVQVVDPTVRVEVAGCERVEVGAPCSGGHVRVAEAATTSADSI